MDTLWPEEDPSRLSNRLSVALSVLRSVLDPDRTFDAQHFVISDLDSAHINLDAMMVDVDAFLRTAAAARRETDPARRLIEMEAAAADYAGDFLEEDPYQDWVAPLREEAKAVFVELARTLAEASLHAARYGDAVRYALKVLERDGFDEAAHLLLVRALVAAGRHGEARRRYRLYVAALDELGAPPAAYPEVVLAAPARRTR